MDEKDHHHGLSSTNTNDTTDRPVEGGDESARSMTSSPNEFESEKTARHDHHSNSDGLKVESETGQSETDIDIERCEIKPPPPTHDRNHDNAETHDPDHIAPLNRASTHNSTKSKASRILSVISRKKTRERIAFAPIPTSDLDEGIVGWESQDDPEMPLNFTQRKKWIVVGLVSAIAVISPLASTILAPGIGSLNEEFHNENSILGTMTVSIYLLGYTIGPLFLAPLSEIYGRKWVLSISNFFFCIWHIGCAMAPNISALIVFRFLTGLGAVGCVSLAPGIIADVFRVDERGFALGMYTLGPLVGPTAGPLIGGWLAQTIGWRWDFWIVFIVAVLISLMIVVFSRETNAAILMDRKVARLRKELNRPDLRSCYRDYHPVSHPGEIPTPVLTPRRILLNGLIRPTKLLFLSPLLFFLALYVAFIYGALFLLFTTIPTTFETTYNFTVGLTGLVYLSLGIGFLSGWVVVTLSSDKIVIRLTKANDGVFEPEMRMPMCIYFAILLPSTFFWYGWSAYYKTHWIVPILGLFPFATGLIGVYLPIIAYVVDSYSKYAASAVAGTTVFRSLVGMLLPLAGPAMYSKLGLGWGNSLLGFICIAMIPVPVFIHRFGKRLRKRGVQL
ncbi:major facilitator superfamily domain-containing protein [Bombardia bombarda]|uniref:Major facilitator superfamily domain-containing protein n=1 Tax=Bombardia bombarda TaxID=252184 RepID=A0AA39XBZ4_9PEZI|nr:major facilitator superfamily domain-containing protein [Bombardia bombarda]